MIRRILTPLDPSPYSETALKYSCYIAHRQHAEITGMVILDIPGIEKSIGAVAPGALYWAEKLEKSRVAEAQKRIEQLLQKFEKTCQKEGVTCHKAEDQGSPSERIVWESLFYDLVVMGLRTHFQFETSDKPGKTLDKVLSQTITPVLAVPEHYYEIRNVLIAFDGSLPAARALQRFAHLAIPYDFNFTLLYAGDDKDTAMVYLNKAEEYLKAYSQNNVQKEWTNRSIIDAMREEYLDKSDLIVLGAHSRSALADFFVGSVTKYLINESNKVLFIGQ